LEANNLNSTVHQALNQGIRVGDSKPTARVVVNRSGAGSLGGQPLFYGDPGNTDRVSPEMRFVGEAEGRGQSPAKIALTDDGQPETPPLVLEVGISDELDTGGGKEPSCGEWKSVFCLNCGFSIPILDGCGDRHFCGYCRKEYLKRVHGRFGPVIDKMSAPLRFMTLTVVSGFDLEERMDHLMHSLKRLKQWIIWKGRKARPARKAEPASEGKPAIKAQRELKAIPASVRGGLRVFEITYNPENGWHPHLHILYEGEYVDQAELSAAWKKITKDSNIVDVRSWSYGKARNEMIKYTLKNVDAIPEEKRAEVRRVLRNRRLFVTFGSMYGTEDKKKTAPCPKCGAREWWPDWLPMEWAVQDSGPNFARAPPCNISKTKEPEDELPF